MNDTQSDDRTERAARTLAFFEGSDAFTVHAAENQSIARDVYRTRAAALLARTRPVPVGERQRAERRPANRPAQVLGISLTRQITVAELAALSPQEITDLLLALATIASTVQRVRDGGTQ